MTAPSESICTTTASKTKEWRNAAGYYHREDGLPAVEYPNGDKYWWINGQLHRTDGPAAEFAGGEEYWYLEGEELTEEEHRRRMLILKLAGVTQ